MRRVVFNKKGGVGKSSIVCNLAAIAARKGEQTLVVDLDPQCNSSQYLLGDAAEEATPNLGDFFEQQLSFRMRHQDASAFVHASPFENLDVMPASWYMADLKTRLEAKHKIFKLRDALAALSNAYAMIFIDTPAALDFFTLSGMVAAQRCLIPFDCDEFSRRAVYDLLEQVEEIRGDHNPQLRVEGIVVNQFVARAKQPQRVVNELVEEGLPVFETRIPSSIKMRESHEASAPLVHHASSHKLTQAYLALYEELRKAPKRKRKAGAAK